jgi:hypothetical protein
LTQFSDDLLECVAGAGAATDPAQSSALLRKLVKTQLLKFTVSRVFVCNEEEEDVQCTTRPVGRWRFANQDTAFYFFQLLSLSLTHTHALAPPPSPSIHPTHHRICGMHQRSSF